MKYGVYVIQDRRTSFMSPMVDLTHQSAIRNFEHAIVATDGIMNSHPQDFALYRIGDFDSDSGTIDALPVPEFIIDGSDIALVQKNESKGAK